MTGADPSPLATEALRGEGAWKGIYTVVSLIGFALIVWGFGQARLQPVVLWQPLPAGVRHLASLLTLVAFVLLAAAYVPRNGIKARVHHPMILGVKTWALAHLLANHTLADLLLFGSFLVWALIEGNIETRLPFLAHNQKLVRQVQELEHKARRQDVLVDDELIHAFYDQQLPPEVHSGASLEHWYRIELKRQPKLLSNIWASRP